MKNKKHDEMAELLGASLEENEALEKIIAVAEDVDNPRQHLAFVMALSATLCAVLQSYIGAEAVEEICNNPTDDDVVAKYTNLNERE